MSGKIVVITGASSRIGAALTPREIWPDGRLATNHVYVLFCGSYARQVFNNTRGSRGRNWSNTRVRLDVSLLKWKFWFSSPLVKRSIIHLSIPEAELLKGNISNSRSWPVRTISDHSI